MNSFKVSRPCLPHKGELYLGFLGEICRTKNLVYGPCILSKLKEGAGSRGPRSRGLKLGVGRRMGPDVRSRTVSSLSFPPTPRNPLILCRSPLGLAQKSWSRVALWLKKGISRCCSHLRFVARPTTAVVPRVTSGPFFQLSVRPFTSSGCVLHNDSRTTLGPRSSPAPQAFSPAEADAETKTQRLGCKGDKASVGRPATKVKQLVVQIGSSRRGGVGVLLPTP